MTAQSSSELRLHAVLEPFGPAGALVLSDEQVAALGSVKNPPVVVRIGQTSARLRISRMGGRNCIGFSKAVRATFGVELGDEIDAVITLDSAERTVDVPAVLAAALDAEPALRAAFDALSYTRRKELARGIAEAKQDATRERRLAAALEKLRG
ncbi:MULTISPECIES: YdeI/OmpD-associated family protein [Bacteria]|uniref:YdeI/OmpD-associated family protein n=1 Tax=Bacteria TaxID=2 RepID=UPI003C7E5BC6